MSAIPVKYDDGVLQDIRARAVDGSQAMPFGGLEIGGVLYGRRAADGQLTILAWRPLACEHAKGPGLQLSPRDEEAFKTQLHSDAADPLLTGLSLLGWFRSTRRQALHLSPEDVALHHAYFPEPWQVVLVIKPRVFGASHVAVFTPAAGEAPVQFFEIEPTASAFSPRMERPAFAESRSRRAPAPIAAPQPPPIAPPAPGPDPVPPFVPSFTTLSRPSQHRFPLWTLGLALLLLGAGAAGAWYLNHSLAVQPVPLQISVEGSDIRLAWNPDAPAVRAAAAGRLEIHEAGATRTVPLDRAALAGAHATYAAGAAGDVTVKLILDTPAGPIEQSAQYISGGKAGAARRHLEELTAERDRLKQEVSKLTERALFAERQLDRIRGIAPSSYRLTAPATRPPAMRTPPGPVGPRP